VVREFTITERMKFQIRGEFFNALNQVNLGTPNRSVNTPQFGTITDARTRGAVESSHRVLGRHLKGLIEQAPGCESSRSPRKARTALLYSGSSPQR
jgi:hypothetical protein